nr:MAG TPA: hypothetical protein [Caudoviricetes sp.]
MITSYKSKIYVASLGQFVTSYKNKIFTGRSVLWNQLFNQANVTEATINNVKWTNPNNGTIRAEGAASAESLLDITAAVSPIDVAHKVLVKGCPYGGSASTYFIGVYGSNNTLVGIDTGAGIIVNYGTGFQIKLGIANGLTSYEPVFRPQVYDLTLMFGEGSEPSSLVEFQGYFGNTTYAYETGITQPLMRISHKRKIAGQLPQLASPQNVVVQGKNVRWDSVEYATIYKIRLDSTLIGFISQPSVDITTLPRYSSMPLGTYKLNVLASAPGYLDSNPSQEVTFINGYPITFSVTHCTYSPTATMVSAFESTTFIFTKSAGYSLPSSITVTGVSSEKYSWVVASNGQTATLVIIEPTTVVTVAVAAVVESYAVTVNGTNASKKSGPTTIQYGGAGTFTFEYPSGYFAPDTVTVSGAILDSWDKTASELVVRDVSGPVTITIVGVSETYAVNYNLTNCAAYSGNPTNISSGASGVQFRINKVDYYELPQNIADITVANAALDSWALSADGAYGIATISNPTGDVTIAVNGVSVYDYTFDETTGVLTLNKAPYSQNGDELTIL